MSSADTRVSSRRQSSVASDLNLDQPETTITTPAGSSHGSYSRGQKGRRTAMSKTKPEKKAHAGNMLNRWPRAFARLFDLAWEVPLVMVLLSLLIQPGAADIFNARAPMFYVALLVSLPLALLLDALIAGIFTNTPAKALIGVRATSSRGERLGLGTHLKRNLGVWTDGLAMGIAPLSVFSMMKQFNRVSGRREAFYDERLHIRMRSGRFTALRVFIPLAALLALTVMLSSVPTP